MKKIVTLITSVAFLLSMMQGCQNTLTMTMTEEELENIMGSYKETTGIADDDTSVVFSSEELNSDYDPADYETIVFDNGAVTTSDENAVIDGSTITIKSDKDYIVTGEIEEGQIIVDAYRSYAIQLILDNVTMTNSTSAPIIAKTAMQLKITLADGSQNYLSANISDENADFNACVYSVPDVVFNGTGSLEINATNGNGVISEDLIKLVEGDYIINADLDGLVTENSIRINTASALISVGSQALNCTTADSNIILDGVIMATGNVDSQTFTNLSTVVVFSTTLEASTSDDVVIFDTDGNQILNFSPLQEYTSILIATNQLDASEMYTTSQG